MAWVHHVQKIAYVKLIVKTGRLRESQLLSTLLRSTVWSHRGWTGRKLPWENPAQLILQLMLKNEPLTDSLPPLISTPHLILNTSTLSTEAFNIHPTLFYLSYEAPGTAPDGICPSFCSLPGTAWLPTLISVAFRKQTSVQERKLSRFCWKERG